MKIPEDYYLHEDVVSLARHLLGKKLVTRIDGIETAGLINETEAYAGESDRASHAYGGRRTARTEVMYARGGTAYVYLCYGIHSLFNVVTNVAGIPHAVLIRSIVPVLGKDVMEQRRGWSAERRGFSSGPGTLSKALGIHHRHTGLSLLGETIWLEETGLRFPKSKVKTGPRIGVEFAGKDALLPYRFWIEPEHLF